MVSPRVGLRAAVQPWALRLNPFGIGEETRMGRERDLGIEGTGGTPVPLWRRKSGGTPVPLWRRKSGGTPLPVCPAWALTNDMKR